MLPETSLDDQWHSELSLNDGLKMCLVIMKNIMEEKLSPDTIQICVIDTVGVRFLLSSEIASIIE